MNNVRFGFLGAGFIASKALGPAVHHAGGAELYAAAAMDTGRAGRLEPSTSVFGSYQDLIDDENVDIVYISLTNDQHLPWILRALDAGKHVMCEKPMCLTAGETRTAFDSATKNDRLLVEATWHRWHPRTQRAAQLVAEGALGRVGEVIGRFAFGGVPADNYRLQPSRGGGALYDVGCYTISAALWALPQPISVTTAEFAMGTTGVDLSVVMELSGGSGGAHLSASIDSPEEQRLTITGSESQLNFVDDSFMSWRVESHLEIVRGGAVITEEFPPVDAYQLMVEAVAQRVRGENAWVIAPEDSIAVAITMDAVRESAKNAMRNDR
jgi:xylose dehydrogenase (NAD/NADP)